ncbi:MAG: PilN domain-containing protein [Sedimentisphaerales bacterium]|nr:PilN domain-containing protein [Sedimentisphaerales bacterium]
MKDIDLLPEWYKKGRRRQQSYRAQYMVLCGVLIVMMAWTLCTIYSISKAKAALAKDGQRQLNAAHLSDEFAQVQKQIEKFQTKSKFLDYIDSKIDVPSVLAEMSFLIDQGILLSKVEFTAEKLTDGGDKSGAQVRLNSVRAARSKNANGQPAPVGAPRFRIVITGIAPTSSDVADLVCRLEQSPYFCQVYPLFSRNIQIKTQTLDSQDTLQASEFEIGFYLANYDESVTDGYQSEKL